MKGYKKAILYAFFIACLFLLITVAIFNLILRYYISDRRIREFPFEISKVQYPFLKSEIFPEISSKAVVIMDDESKTVLFAKNPNLSFSMASTTKIMTALVALDYYKINDVLIVKKENVEGVNVGFEIGEKLNFPDILYAMLLPSGNDAALVLAQNYRGGEKAFVAKMNEKAYELTLKNTNFADAIGLEDSRDYTTPLDLARLASYALRNKIFADIVATKIKEIADVTGQKKYELRNLNKLLGASGVNGVKTGYTNEAGQVLVTSKIEIDENNKEHTLIIVVMDSLDRFSDTSKLLNSVAGNINYLSIHP